MDKVKTLIIEDEAPARRLLLEFLREYPDIEVVGECSDGFDGAKKILELQPELVFLDIRMPRINGFEMLELLTGEKMPLIVFTTAYDNFAIKAFDYNTCDYLLKPVGKERFGRAMHKALDQLKVKNAGKGNFSRLVDQGLSEGGFLERIVVRFENQIRVVQCDDLLCIEANDDYVVLHTEKARWQKKQTLKFYENKLDPKVFMRVHRSFIVRVSSLNRIEPYSKDAYIAVLTNGVKISVSKAGYQRLRKLMDF